MAGPGGTSRAGATRPEAQREMAKLVEQRTRATEELASRFDRQARLVARVDQVAAEERAAVAASQQASDRLVSLEREAASGGKVTPAKRREAEDELLRAKTAALAPWPERRAAARLAVEDSRLNVARFAAEHLDELLVDLATEGRAAAEKLAAAAQAVLDAYAERADVDQRTHALIALVGRVRPGDVQRARGEQLAAEAERLLLAGGELAPDVLHRPNEPRHAAIAETVPA